MKHLLGFDEAGVKEEIGTENYNAFLKWMNGQTVGVHPETEETIFYPHDVDRFKAGLEKTLLGEKNDKN